MRCELFYKRCREFLAKEDLEGLEEFCKKEASQTIGRIRRYIEFWDAYMADVPIGTISEGALRPLIEEPERDPDLTKKVVEKLKIMATKKRGKKKPRISSEDVKKTLAEAKGKVYLTSTERKQVGSETHLKQTEAACEKFLSMEPEEREALLNDLKRVVDLLGSWGARVDPALRAKIEPAREQVDSLRNEFLLFLPEDE